MTLLDVRDLRVEFDTDAGIARAVDGVSFSVRAAEAVALLGESGCGKTVTALAIMGLIDRPGRVMPGSAVEFDGRSVLSLPAPALRGIRGARIGFVFADSLSAFNPLLPVGEQIVEAILAHERDTRSRALARATDMLARTGLSDPGQTARRYPSELSGGQRQRAALAMALVLRPALLIADEPTSALDVTTQAQVLDLLATLRKEFGTALLLITHDLGVVRVAASRALVMYAGQIVEEAHTASLLDAPAHPYTRGLVGAWPRLGDARRALRPIAGMVPPATAWPSGCRFRERCGSAWGLCESEAPTLERVHALRAIRCHLAAVSGA